MANDPKNVFLGACQIVWGTKLIGLTIGGVELQVVTSTRPVTTDQAGTTCVTSFITGRNAIIKLNMAETTLNDFYAILAGAGATQPNGPNTYVQVQTTTGLALLPDVAPMLLRPMSAPDGSQDMLLPAVAYTGDISFAYKFDAPRCFSLTFVAFPDVLYKLFYYGSSAAAMTMGSYINDSSHFNIQDPVFEDRLWDIIVDADGNEMTLR